MTQNEINEFFDNKDVEVYKDKPKIGDYFGVIGDIYSVLPYNLKDIMCFGYFYISDENDSIERLPLLFKRIDEETAVEISTGIPFLFEPKMDFEDISNPIEKIKTYTEKFHKYREICLEIGECDYIVPNDELKKVYANVLKNDSEELKTYLDYMSRKAHEAFEEKTTRILNEAHSIAMVDNVIYDIEKKHKVNVLTRQNDEQN